jgi:adenylate cyclase
MVRRAPDYLDVQQAEWNIHNGKGHASGPPTVHHLVERHGLEKIKTTGDGYMVVSGVPVARSDHLEMMAQFALEMLRAAAEITSDEGERVPIRIGLACGPVVAGVVGTRKFFYDVWGDAVNIASQMESTGIPGRIQVTQQVHERLRAKFAFEARGLIEVKGKGRMSTWFLLEPLVKDAPAAVSY